MKLPETCYQTVPDMLPSRVVQYGIDQPKKLG